MNRPLSHRIVITALIAIIIGACSVGGRYGNGDDNYFSAFHTFGSREWAYADALTFRVDTLRDSVAPGGDMLLSVRHTHGYGYSNLWLEVARMHSDSVLCADTVNVMLADRFGNWRGTGSGPSLLVVDTIGRNVSIARGDTFRVRHIMRLDTLADIEQIGLIFLPKQDENESIR